MASDDVFGDVGQTGVMAEIEAPPRVHDDTGAEGRVVVGEGWCCSPLVACDSTEPGKVRRNLLIRR